MINKTFWSQKKVFNFWVTWAVYVELQHTYLEIEIIKKNYIWMITFASSHISRSEPTVFAPPEIWENCMIIISYCKYMSCSRKLMTKWFVFLPATTATSTRKMTEKFMLVGGWRQGWWRLLWKRTSRRPDQGRGGGRELLKVDMNSSAQVFTLGFFAIHKSSIPSTTPSNKNCQSLSSTSVKSGCMDDKKKPNQTFLKTAIRYMFGAFFKGRSHI